MGLTLKSADMVFLDTSPFIYFFEKHPAYCHKIMVLLDQVYACNAQIVTSIITYIELTTHPARLGEHALVSKYRDYLTHSENISLFPLDIAIADTAVQLRAKYNFKTPDAIQLATAIRCGADYIITNDKEWRKVEDMAVIVLDDLE